MDDNTKFLLERIDKLEEKIFSKLDALEAFKNKVLGMSFVVAGAASLLVEIIFKK